MHEIRSGQVVGSHLARWLLPLASLIMLLVGCQSAAQSDGQKEATGDQAALAATTVELNNKAGEDMHGIQDGPITQEHVQIPFQLDNKEFKPLLELAEQGPIIPGLKQGLIPQGVAYDAERQWLLVSGYHSEKGKPSVLSILDAGTGKLLKSVNMAQADGMLYTEHAGGVAVSRQHAWISSGGVVYSLSLTDLEAAQDGDQVGFKGHINSGVRASYTAYHDGILWVGEFAQGKEYETDASHIMTDRDGKEHKAWVVGYRLDEKTDDLSRANQDGTVEVPDYILSVQDRIQGIAFWKGWIVLSDSYGRNTESSLVFHKSPLLSIGSEEGQGHSEVKVNGQSVPVWYLDGANLLGSIDGPPMSEGIVPVGDVLHILYESAGINYLSSGSYPLDTMLLLDAEKAASKLKQ